MEQDASGTRRLQYIAQTRCRALTLQSDARSLAGASSACFHVPWLQSVDPVATRNGTQQFALQTLFVTL